MELHGLTFFKMKQQFSILHAIKPEKLPFFDFYIKKEYVSTC